MPFIVFLNDVKGPCLIPLTLFFYQNCIIRNQKYYIFVHVLALPKIHVNDSKLT